MRDVTIRQLEYLQAVRQLEHFRKAADHCGVSQPGLSSQLKKLEDTLGLMLFDRDKRHVAITPVGRQLADIAVEILQKVEEFEHVARRVQGDLTGPLRLGIIPSMAPYLIRHVLTEISAEFPSCEPNVHEALTATLVEGLLAGDIDVAIVATPTGIKGLEEYTLFDDHFVLATQKDALGPQVII
ncbi:MAG: LysR family transcriptional regulator, partial [Pseudomonadota bacterium]